MASTIITKNSSTASATPAVGDLQQGELAVNVTDKKVYTKDSSAVIVKLVGSLGNQEASAVAITGGSIAGITDLAVADGGTGSSTAVGARSNLSAAASGANSDITSLSGLTTALSVAQGGTGVTSSTGSGSVVLSNSPTLVTPALGTPSAAVLTNATGLPLSTGISGLGTGVATFLGTPSSANLLAAVTDETGTGALVFANSPTLVTPALGTPASATLTNATGLPIGTGVSGLGTGVATALAVNVGSAGAPVVNGGVLGTPSSATLTNATGLPISTGVSGLGTGVATALAVNVGSAGAPVVNGGALGTPSSGTVTNLTGTASININGTVGATTPTTGAFTTLSASSSVTLSGGTANGVTYLNGSKVLTSGSALTFDGSRLGVGVASAGFPLDVASISGETLRLRGTATTGVSQVLFTSDTAGTNYAYLGSASGYLAFGMGASSEGMRLTSTGLGIGTSSPSTRLEVQGTTPTIKVLATNLSGATTSLELWGSGGGANYKSAVIQGINYGQMNLQTPSGVGTNSFITFATDATERMRLDSAGNLGLGVTPLWAAGKGFEIGSNGNALASVNSTQTTISQNAYHNGTNWTYARTSTAVKYQQYAGTHTWQTAASGTAGNAITFTDAMTLDASGNLLVGTTSGSGFKFAVLNGAGNLARFTNGATQTLDVVLDSSGAILQNPNDGYIAFKGSSAERARIDSSGNLLVGTTSGGYQNSNSIAIQPLALGAYVITNHANGTVSGREYSIFTYNASAIGSITQNGTTAVAYNTSSDYRLKNITGPITTSGAYIDSLNPVEGTWKADGSTFVGLIAHEVQEASRTQVATGTKDGAEMQAMDYSNSELIANLIAEVKSLRARVAQLETN